MLAMDTYAIDMCWLAIINSWPIIYMYFYPGLACTFTYTHRRGCYNRECIRIPHEAWMFVLVYSSTLTFDPIIDAI
jgi:hypothetical protein